MRAQVAIVGGGVMGVSLLYHLAKEGWKDIILFEKNDLTHGSTWHAAGLCTHFAHSPAIQELRAASVQLYRDILPQETGRDVGFHACGAMRITRLQSRMHEFAHVAGLSKFSGHELRLIDPDEIEILHPLTRTSGLIGGIYEPDDGYTDPVLVTGAMAEVARKHGAAIKVRTPVTAIRQDNGAWSIATERFGCICDHIVIAAGAWSWEIGRMLRIEIPAVPVLHQYLVLDEIPAVLRHQQETGRELPIIRDPEESWYVRQERNGFILGPYERDAQVWSVDGVPPEFGADLLPSDLDPVEHIIDGAMARIPALREGGLKSVINGPITFSPDANPLIGPAQGVDNVWLLTGSSMGIMEGGGAGRFLAHWMAHGCPPMDATQVDPRRFGKWADRNFRVEKAKECFGFQFGIHFPYEERPAGRGKRHSALHDELARLGAVFGSVNGWERPNWFATAPIEDDPLTFLRPGWFSAVAGEVRTATDCVGFADLSALAKFTACGPDAARFVDELGTGAAPDLNRIKLTYALAANGGIESEFTAARLAPDRMYLTSASAAEAMDADLLQNRSRRYDVEIANVTDDYSVIAVIGPNSRALLQGVTDCDLSDSGFPWLSAMEINIAGCGALAMRLSYAGELGWELHAPRRSAKRLFLALLDAGRSFDAACIGAYALNSMRLEKGYKAWGSELTTELTPAEAGLPMAAPTETGCDAPVQLMHLLAIDCQDVDPFHGHAVFTGDQPVGIVTSGSFGHRTGLALAMAQFREPVTGSDLNVEILGKRYRARVLTDCPFDPENSRMKHSDRIANPGS